MKKFHDEQLQQNTQTNATNSEHLQTEIRTLKRLYEEKEDEVNINPSISHHLLFIFSCINNR